jgi:hypothetical protein
VHQSVEHSGINQLTRLVKSWEWGFRLAWELAWEVLAPWVWVQAEQVPWWVLLYLEELVGVLFLNRMVHKHFPPAHWHPEVAEYRQARHHHPVQ